MMRIRYGFALILGLAFCFADPASVVAKEKPSKAAAVKIIKPSETRYKQARIVKKEKKRKARFLWFGKKKEKKIEVRQAPIARVNEVEPRIIEPSVTDPSSRLEAKEKAAPVLNPEANKQPPALRQEPVIEGEVTSPEQSAAAPHASSNDS